MEIQSINSISREKRDRLIDNTVDAFQTLFRSVLERKEREMVSERIKNGLLNKKYGKRNSTSIRTI